MGTELHHFVGGERIAGTSGRTGDVYNPATGEVQARCPYASAAELDAAVDIAARAGREWAKTSIAKRLQVVFEFRNRFVAATDRLVEAIGLEHGKTRPDARGELQRSVEAIEFACSMPHLTKGEYSLNIGGSIDNFSIVQPLGVVACITPFNFPAMVPVMSSTMAVAVGNAVIVKPSERVPSAALLLGELWREAGLPDGIWNVVNGDKEAVDAILAHPGISAVSFVGSTRVAEHVYTEGCAHGKRVMAFGGGKNHMVVMPDADLDLVADAFVGAGYGSAAQRCMAISLAVPVGERTADALVERLVPRVEGLRIGPYDDPVADFGPLITFQARETVRSAIDDGVAAGARVHVDGRGASVSGYEDGFFLGGTLIDDVTPDMAFYQQEVFGPARGIVRAGDVDEAIRLVNEHEFGNGVAIFTRDGHAARRFFDEVDVGMIGVNVPIPVPAGYHNFGGLKRSKFGEGHMFGPDAARFWTKLKTVSARWPEPKADDGGADMAMPTNR
jgi:malonate-semialdehyde dehydrogenase (acetylating)/methylmalonate-semialdehyde dehydrogenase